MKNEIWIARDKPMHGAEKGDVIIYGQKPWRDEKNGVFCPQNVKYEEMMFFECCDTTDMICLNPDVFPEITWENSPQRLTINQLKS